MSTLNEAINVEVDGVQGIICRNVILRDGRLIIGCLASSSSASSSSSSSSSTPSSSLFRLISVSESNDPLPSISLDSSSSSSSLSSSSSSASSSSSSSSSSDSLSSFTLILERIDDQEKTSLAITITDRSSRCSSLFRSIQLLSSPRSLSSSSSSSSSPQLFPFPASLASASTASPLLGAVVASQSRAHSRRAYMGSVEIHHLQTMPTRALTKPICFQPALYANANNKNKIKTDYVESNNKKSELDSNIMVEIEDPSEIQFTQVVVGEAIEGRHDRNEEENKMVKGVDNNTSNSNNGPIANAVVNASASVKPFNRDEPMQGPFPVAYTLIRDCDSRDKVLKLLQYLFRLITQHAQTASLLLGVPTESVLPVCTNISASISNARRVLRLCKWMYSVPPLYHYLSEIKHWSQNRDQIAFPKQSAVQSASLVCAIISDTCEELVWWSTLGGVTQGNSLTVRARYWLPLFWFPTIIVDLSVSLSVIIKLLLSLKALKLEKMRNDANKRSSLSSSLSSSSSSSPSPLPSPSSLSSPSPSLLVRNLCSQMLNFMKLWGDFLFMTPQVFGPNLITPPSQHSLTLFALASATAATARLVLFSKPMLI